MFNNNLFKVLYRKPNSKYKFTLEGIQANEIIYNSLYEGTANFTLYLSYNKTIDSNTYTLLENRSISIPFEIIKSTKCLEVDILNTQTYKIKYSFDIKEYCKDNNIDYSDYYNSKYSK